MAGFEQKRKTFTSTSRISNFVRTAFTEAGLIGSVETLGLIPISAGFLQPGDVIAFNYRAEGTRIHVPVVVLIVQTDLSSGTRISRGTGNRLITCFKVENTEESQAILRNLYKDKVGAKIQALPGPDSYRTYIMNSAHISNMMELTLNLDKGAQ